MPSFAQTLLAYGAQPEQLIDLADGSSYGLRYADLKKGDATWSLPIVAEHEHVPRVFIFDGRTASGEVSQDVVNQWCRRILLRGDPAWTAILRPGRLDVLSFDIQGNEVSVQKESLAPGSGGLARFILDVRSGASDLPRRAYLKDLLSESMQQAIELGVSPINAMSLVGWGLFWRFLIDRDLLAGKNPADIARGANTWTACLNSKGRALETLRWLDSTFNGELLPFDVPPADYAPQVFSQVLGNIASGATSQGQLRLPTDWDEIDFSHVPVGLLSEVYQAFATSLDTDKAKQQSIYYTPLHIAEFVMAEALEANPDIERPRVLDPAAGAGVFLIAAFRQLVQREWQQTGVQPQRPEIRRILSTQLFAFDIDTRALRLAKLGLYLTALELDPDPKPVESLKFVRLEKQIRLHPLPDGSLGAVKKEDVGQFDVVVGNPPWTAHSLAAKKRWVANTGSVIRERLGEAMADFDLPDADPDLAFLWRAGEWAAPGGQIALALHASWLFGLSPRLLKARQLIFKAFNVTGILNGAALRFTQVWPNVDTPFCLLFARNESAPKGAALQFVSPFVETEDTSEQAVLRIDWADAHTVLHDEVTTIPWALKSRFRGDPLSRRVLETVHRVGIPLGSYLDSLKPGLKLLNGYLKGGKAGKKQSAEHMYGMPDLKGAATQQFFINDASLLPQLQEQTLLRPRSPQTYQAPLLVVRQTMLSDWLKPWVFRSDVDVAFSGSFHGVSFKEVADGHDHVRLLQILLQSQLGEFVLLLTDARYGVERDAIYKESLNAFPVTPLSCLTEKQLKRMRSLSQEMKGRLDHQFFNKLNEFVFDLYGLDVVERIAVADTVQTRSPRSASVKRAVTPPTDAERNLFYAALKESLDDVLQASDLTVATAEFPNSDIPWRLFSVSTKTVSPVSAPIDEITRTAEKTGTSLVVLPVSPSHVIVGLPDRYRYWTQTKAVLLAHELLGGPLGGG